MKVFQSHSQGKRSAGAALKLAALAGLGVAAVPGISQAANVDWNVADGNWATAGNWNPAMVPGPSDFAFIGNGGTSRVNSDVPDTLTVAVFNGSTLRVETGGDLNVANPTEFTEEGVRIGDGFALPPGATGVGNAVVTGTGRLSTSGTTAGNFIQIGASGGTGTLTQDSADSVVQSSRDILVGTDVGSTGTYNQSAGTANTGWFEVGRLGATGTYNLSGGSVNNTGAFFIGRGTGSNGTATMSGNAGTISNNNDVNIGLEGGTGTLNQSAGTMQARNWGFIGRNGGDGTYNQSGGTFESVGWMRIGEAGSVGPSTGAYNLSGNAVVRLGAVAGGIGNADVGDDLLVVGVGNTNGVGATGLLTIRDNARVDIGNSLEVGSGGATGTVTQSGGTINANNDASVGFNANSTGTYEMSAGALNITNTLFVGRFDTSTGTMTQTGGTINANNGAVGSGAGTGTVNQSGGTASYGNLLRIGVNGGGGVGNGTYTIGGSAQLAVTGGLGRIGIGDGLGAVGTLNINDNAVVTIFSNYRLGTGGVGATETTAAINGGTGTVNQTGGTVSFGAGAPGILTVGGFASSGVYNLSGGVLDGNGGTINRSASANLSDFNFTGGRLQDVANIGFSLEQDGGTLAPGASPGTTTIAGNYTQAAPGTLEIEILGLSAGTEFDQLVVNGAVSVLGNLDLLAGSGLAAGNEFLILLNDSTDAIAGNFIGKLDDSTFVEDGYTFMIDYQGGDGNDVLLSVVSAVPEPTALAVLGLGAMGLLARRRRSRVA